MNSDVRVAIAGVGNCASALIQGVEYYRMHPELQRASYPNGLISNLIGDYSIESIKFVAAFDVAGDKVGRDLSEAIKSSNVCTRTVANIGHYGVLVRPGVLLDGIGETAAKVIEISDQTRVNPEDAQWVTDTLKDAQADVLVNFVPVGSKAASKFYADCAIRAGCAFINAIPVPIARDELWRKKFSEARLPLIGDDVKSQVGATIVHRSLVELFSSRGYCLDKTYQLNVGGNTDFLNMMSRERLVDKRISKVQSILDVANRGHGLPEGNYHISPSDHVPFLKDNKLAFIRLEGRGFAGAPIDIEVRLSVEDSPNSAGVVVDAVRYAKVAMDRKEGGYLHQPSAWLMKAPAFPLSDSSAESATAEWMQEPKVPLDNT